MSGRIVKWMVSLPESLDVSVRHRLVQEGLRKGDLSAFVVEAMREQLCRRNLAALRSANRERPSAALQAAVEAAVSAVRAQTFGAGS
jgi:hypothetical protein